MLVLIGLLGGLVCLFYGGDWLVEGASKLARSLGISALIVGLTIVAMGTSMPELLVSVSAALKGSADISVGNVVGSNIANIALILGVSGLIYPISIHVNLLRREIPIMVVVAIVVTIMFLDGEVGRFDGTILVAGMLAFIAFMIYSSRQEQKVDHHIPEDEDVIAPESINRVKELGRIVIGTAVLMVGAQLTVDNAVLLAQAVGISERVIGLTLVAVGTSLPELVTSTTAAFRKESDIAIGNVVGSNIFNVVGILGVTTLIQPVNVVQQMIQFDAPVMIGLSLLLIPMAWNQVLGRREATFFLIAYVVYLFATFVIFSS